MPINLDISAHYNKSILSSAVSRTDSELENKVIMVIIIMIIGMSINITITIHNGQYFYL